MVGGWTGGAPTGLTTTLASGHEFSAWDVGQGPDIHVKADQTSALPTMRATNKLYALGGDTQGGGFFDSTNEVDELDLSAWPGGTWTSSTPNLPSPNRQANQAGFYGGGNIWSVGGLDGSTFTFLPDVLARPSCGGGGTPTPTPTATATPNTYSYGNADTTRQRLLLLRRRGLRRRPGREARQLHAHKLQLSWLDSGTRERKLASSCLWMECTIYSPSSAASNLVSIKLRMHHCDSGEHPRSAHRARQCGFAVEPKGSESREKV